jgi:hypothetical protein
MNLDAGIWQEFRRRGSSEEEKEDDQRVVDVIA